MIIAALRWAWGQPLKPSAKLVLLALVQHADRNGECWPKQARLVEMTGFDPRTIKRLLKEICELGLLDKTAGFGRTTSHYKLRGERWRSATSERADDHLRGGTVPPLRGHTTPSEVTNRASTPYIELTNELSIEDLNTTTTSTVVEKGEQEPEALERGGGEWIFPKELTEEQRAVATKILERVNSQAQLLLDELAGQMKDGAIRVSPMACLRGMARKAMAGEFTSERGEKIARDRAKRAASEQRLREAAERKPEVAEPLDPEARARAAAFLSGLRKNMGRPR